MRSNGNAMHPFAIKGETMDEVTRLLQEAQSTKFWGSIQLDFQDGQLNVIRKSETIKIRKETLRDEHKPQQRAR